MLSCGLCVCLIKLTTASSSKLLMFSEAVLCNTSSFMKNLASRSKHEESLLMRLTGAGLRAAGLIIQIKRNPSRDAQTRRVLQQQETWRKNKNPEFIWTTSPAVSKSHITSYLQPEPGFNRRLSPAARSPREDMCLSCHNPRHLKHIHTPLP